LLSVKSRFVFLTLYSAT